MADLHSVEKILKEYILPDSFARNCILYALLSNQKKLCLKILTYHYPLPQNYLGISLRIKSPTEKTIINRSYNALFHHLCQIEKFIPLCYDAFDNLLIHLLEAGWFSPRTPKHILSALYQTFFQPRHHPSDFKQLSVYLLYDNIGCFLENRISSSNAPYPKLPIYFFRPVPIQSPLHLHDKFLLTHTRLPFRIPKISPPSIPHIYA